MRKDAPSMRMVLQPIKQGIDHRLGVNISTNFAQQKLTHRLHSCLIRE
ncbi:MAG: hypothetical protein IPH35_27505 [Rhodoferax sp.]|nr:hypothetical protein [Rhodoferax sp.]